MSAGIFMYKHWKWKRHCSEIKRANTISHMERKVSAIKEDRLKRHPREILKHLENPEDVRRHIKWIRQQRKTKHE